MNTHAMKATHIQVKQPSYEFVDNLRNLVDEIDDICDYDNRKKADIDVYKVYTKYYTFLQENQFWDYALAPYNGTSFTCDSVLDEMAHHQLQYRIVDGKPVTLWWFGKTEWGRKISDDFLNAMLTLEKSIKYHQKKALHHINVPHDYDTRYQLLLRNKFNDLANAVDEAMFHECQYDELVARIDYYEFLTWCQVWKHKENERYYKRLVKEWDEYEASWTTHRDCAGDFYFEETDTCKYPNLASWRPDVKRKIQRLLFAVRALRKEMEQYKSSQ